MALLLTAASASPSPHPTHHFLHTPVPSQYATRAVAAYRSWFSLAPLGVGFVDTTMRAPPTFIRKQASRHGTRRGWMRRRQAILVCFWAPPRGSVPQGAAA